MWVFNAMGTAALLHPLGNADVIVDVVGYYAAGTGGLFHAMSPTRIQDSRPATQLGPYATPWEPGQARDVTVAGVGAVPAEADAPWCSTSPSPAPSQWDT